MLAGEPLNFRWLGAAMVTGIASMLMVIALASQAEIIGLAVLIGASGGIYLLQTKTASARR
jgi:hypothetical protein